VFAVNGDTYFDLDYAAMSAAPACDVLVAARSVADRGRYGSVRLEGQRIAAFQEKGAPGAGLVSAGVYLLRGDLARRLPRAAPFSLERDVLERELDRLSIHAFVSEAAFIDIGTPQDFARAQEVLPAWTGGRVR
jgi:D-glycero-alpha-D-manno-heptose 1-phosphate guanylyltransferase